MPLKQFLIIVILVQFVSITQQLGKAEVENRVKPSRLSQIILLESPPRFYDIGSDCVSSVNLHVSNSKCRCSEYICLINYKFNKLRSLQTCHDSCCKKQRKVLKSGVVE
ncbi:hypothetical protein DMENIID0001_162030 [Sergentomyia squamirostris]